MKKYLLLLLPLLFASAYPQAARPDVGRVTQLQGKYVFYHSAPIQPYERAFSFIDKPEWKGCPNVQDIATAAMKLAREEGQEQQKEFDAIIIQPGERDIAIRFKSTSDDNGLGRFEQREGKYVFMLSTPVDAYQQVSSLKVVAYNVEVFSASKELCLGTEQIIAKLLKKGRKETFDALIYNGTTAETIKFK